MARFENCCSKDVTSGRDDAMCSSREQNTCEWMDVFAPKHWNPVVVDQKRMGME